jgi:hypothetical protein
MRTRALAQQCRRVALLIVIAGFVLGCHKESEEGIGPPPTDRHDGSTKTDPDRAFWNWFTDHAQGLAKKPSLIDVMDEVQGELKKQHHGVIAEIGPAGENRLLVLSADGDRKAFSMVQQLFAARPSVIGWKIVAFRPREAKRPMPTIEMNGRKLNPAALRYLAERNGEKLDIQLYVPGYVIGEETVVLMAFLALDHTLGEYDVETKIGAIDLLPIESAVANSRALDDLPHEVDGIIGAPAR